MCGIVGYVGSKQATPILLEGLKTLEYRGYDSAGLSIQGKILKTIRSEGKISKLEEKVEKFEIDGTCGIAHTRWATHGVPQESNAHPHRDCTGDISIVHNGIVENYRELKTLCETSGHTFTSDTDSEVLAHMIEDQLTKGHSLFLSVKNVLARVRGTYGLVVLSKQHPQMLVVARMGSPLVIGIGEGEYIVASDVSAVTPHTKEVVYLDDGEMAVVTSKGIQLDGIQKAIESDRISTIDWDIETITKGGYEHFMLKEIMEQPEVIENSIRGRIDKEKRQSVLGGLKEVRDQLTQIDRLVIVGCGSAYYAGLVGEYMFEELAGIPVEVELASEFRYRKPILTNRTAVLAVSQSGETADTLEAIREAKRKRVLTLGLVNVVGSSIARETNAGVYNHIGPEIGVASTKAFVSQLTILVLMAMYIAQVRHRDVSKTLIDDLMKLPTHIQKILQKREEINKIVSMLSDAEHCLFLGRTFHTPIAYEGALKLKEVSYIHAEGYSSGEMKHGPIALINSTFPCVALCPNDEVFEKNWSNIQEIQAREGRIVAITTDDLEKTLPVFAQISIPKVHPVLQPILSTIPLQLLAYKMAVSRNLNPDKPRNLAKSVTVE